MTDGEQIEPRFGVWDERTAMEDWDGFLARHPDIPSEDARESLEFLHRAFDQWFGRSPVPEAGHAFVVPTRVSAVTDRWSDDTSEMVPMLRWTDATTRVALLTRVPPFVVDTYEGAAGAAPGAVVYCPLFPDMAKLLPRVEALRVARAIAHETLRFVERMGAAMVGLGGTLPSVTDFGRAISGDVKTTTGHAGTLAVLRLTLRRLTEEGSLPEAGQAVVMGSGAIGTSAAIDLAEKGWTVTAVDASAAARERAGRRLSERYARLDRSTISVAADVPKAGGIDLVVGAATSEVDADLFPQQAVLVDDSQPPCFSHPKTSGDVRTWVVAQDRSTTRFLTRHHYRYGSEGVASRSEAWGCEAEVASLMAADMTSHGISRPATPHDVDLLEGVLDSVGVVAARRQSYGAYI